MQGSKQPTTVSESCRLGRRHARDSIKVSTKVYANKLPEKELVMTHTQGFLMISWHWAQDRAVDVFK